MKEAMQINGILSVCDRKFAIVVARFNSAITSNLLEGAKNAIIKHGGTVDSFDIIWVPGAFELPSTAKKLDSLKIYDAIICLGAVIRGETNHYDFVASNVASGIAAVGQQGNSPIIFGVLTVENVEQALNRSGLKSGNAGYDAALTAIDMAAVFEQIEKMR